MLYISLLPLVLASASPRRYELLSSLGLEFELCPSRVEEPLPDPGESAIVDSQAHGQNFSMAVIFLQIAILLSSVAALMKKIKLWYGGLVIGSLGLLYFSNGFSVFF